MGLIVRGREARPQPGYPSPEAAFAALPPDDHNAALPAGIWVALRRDDPDAAMDALRAVAPRPFLVSEREEMGPGFRLQLVEEKRELPDVHLLRAQLSGVLDVPEDVIALLEDWGVGDPRTQAEIDTLLDSRFGPVGTPTASRTETAPRRRTDSLEISVTDLADVLRLDEAQRKALATLVRAAGLTVVS